MFRISPPIPGWFLYQPSKEKVSISLKKKASPDPERNPITCQKAECDPRISILIFLCFFVRCCIVAHRTWLHIHTSWCETVLWGASKYMLWIKWYINCIDTYVRSYAAPPPDRCWRLGGGWGRGNLDTVCCRPDTDTDDDDDDVDRAASAYAGCTSTYTYTFRFEKLN